RLRVVDETVVHKRHITFALNSAKQKHMEQMFFTDEPWHIDKLPGYSAAERANPFGTFAAIPAHARYQFMLDDAEYFTRTFILGPSLLPLKKIFLSPTNNTASKLHLC